MFFSRPVPDMVTAEAALAGRDQPIVDPAPHFVSQRPLVAPFPDGHQQIIVAMGCFWGAERIMWQTPGVWVTAVGYSGGFTPNPTYEETCSGRTGHTEAVLVDFDPKTVSLEGLMQVFWESHDPTQLFRQGNDVGTQYRSAVYWTDEAQQPVVEGTRMAYAQALIEAGLGPIVTELAPAGAFYYAEDYHQQYLAKNPNGYCGIGGTGVSCPAGMATD